jgi:hypothetical protein
VHRVVVLVALACGCGKSQTDSEREAARAAADRMPKSDESCDPSASRVCRGNDLVACEDGKIGRGLRTCHEGCKNGRCVGVCADGAELIYVVDDSNNLLSFDPRKLPDDPFHLVGRMNCGPGSPFSMGVDRSGIAWVVYSTGELYKVDITDARCQPSGFAAGSSGTTTFGMGFVSDEAGSKTETLFIAGNDYVHELGSIDTQRSVPVARHVGTVQATHELNAELTGTSEAKLYGFFPEPDEPAFVQEIDRKSGSALGPRWTLGSTGLGYVRAYAFAQWGGVFYIFVTTTDSTVRTVDRRTGTYRTVLEHVPYRITGAGVSTCAPELDGAQPQRGS